MVKVNGKEQDIAGMTVSELLEKEGYKREKVAVELDLEIVPKAQYDSCVLKDGCSVEVVSFVGGG